MHLPQVTPAVGVEYGGIEIIVKLLQDRDETLVVDFLLLGIERLLLTQLPHHIVKTREGHAVLSLHAFTMCVEIFREGADSLFRLFATQRERKRIEAARLVIDRAIFKGTTCF